MTSEKERNGGRIPIRFSDAPDESESGEPGRPPVDEAVPDAPNGGSVEEAVLDSQGDDPESDDLLTYEVEDDALGPLGKEASGPVFAELLATRAELKRLEAEANDLRDKFARRQADFENFRKRVERERSETYDHATSDLVKKLLPVLDNLGRALDTEASVEANESDEFRHFLSGVDLIYKQLGGVLETLGVKPVSSIGEPFDPHVHEAVVTEETNDYEPDTVMQEIVRGYRLGSKLLRPALVKVAVKK
jgi:molecular chaperone GrpE